jgi:rhamnosyltransferase
MLGQDTTIAPDMVVSLTEIVRSDPHAPQLAIVGSNFKDKVTGRLNTTVARPGDPGATETVTTITSGSLVSLTVFQLLGGLRDDFFIDCVDHEYCLRARAHGFRVMITSRGAHGAPHWEF